jgi:hypothetical protein
LIGNHWQQYRKNSNLYYTHILQPDVFADHPDAKIVVIDVDPKDYRKVTELYVSKAWPELWTPQEYQKWAGPGWPPYSPTNIEESVMIRRELIDDLTVNETQRWFLENQHLDTHYRINFRTIMGIDQHDLVDVICDMMHGKANASVRRYVEQYQNLNKNLYFNDY